MTLRTGLTFGLLTLGVFAPGPVTGQDVPQEISELRRRVAAIRAQMAQVTASADYAADIFTRNPDARFLISSTISPGLRAEFDWHTGASPEMLDADNPTSRGIVILPVRSWQSSGFSVGAAIERWESSGRPVIVLGSKAGAPAAAVVRHLVPNGAPDAGSTHSAINDAANLIAAWTLYVEFVASATRQHWQPGIYVSHLIPGADDSNYKIKFRTISAAPVVPIAPGVLGNQYLDRIDSLLAISARPQHQASVQRAADSLRAARAAGKRVFVAACGNYLQRGLATDSVDSPFRPVLARFESVPPLVARGAKSGEAVLWFGYDGYDCPHVQAAGPLQDAGFKVVVVSDHLPARFPPNVIGAVALDSRIPERIGRVPFNGEGVGSASSVEALLHYLWIRRLVAQP